MPDSPNLALPYLDQGQAMKHVTHNEALRLLDALVQLRVEERGRTAPPASPAPGARYLVGAPATGAFAGQEGRLALYDDGAWRFVAPRAGFLAYVAAEALLMTFDGAAWRPVAPAPSSLDLARLGIGTASDPGNPLSAKLNDALFVARAAAEGGTGSLRLKASKEAAAGTASFLFQTAYSGRAEFGLLGDDRLRVKVSPDGAAWTDALLVSTAGRVSFPGGVDLPFAPVEQGGGAGQLANKLRLGWDGGGVRAQVDAADLGRLWSDSLGASVLAASGRQRLPSGLLVQWGIASHPSIDPVVTFPIPFPTAAFIAQATVAANPGAAAHAGATVDALSATGLTLRPRTIGGGTVSYCASPVHWLALGR